MAATSFDILCDDVQSLTSTVVPRGNYKYKVSHAHTEPGLGSGNCKSNCGSCIANPQSLCPDVDYCDDTKSYGPPCPNPWNQIIGNDPFLGINDPRLREPPSYYHGIELQLKEQGYNPQDLGCEDVGDIDYGIFYDPNLANPSGLNDYSVTYSKWNNRWSCNFAQDPETKEIYKVTWDPKWDRDCCLGNIPEGDWRCGPTSCPKDPASKCSTLQRLCAGHNGDCAKSDMLNPTGKCHEWYLSQQMQINGAPLENAIGGFCNVDGPWAQYGDCACYNFGVAATGARVVPGAKSNKRAVIGKPVKGHNGDQAMMRADIYCLPEPAGAPQMKVVGGNNGTKSCDLWCKLQGTAGESDMCKLAYATESKKWVPCGSITNETMRCYCGSVNTDPSTVYKARDPDGYAKHCTGDSTSVPISGTGEDPFGFPNVCWLADCQANPDTCIFYDPVQFAQACPSTCVQLSAGNAVNIQDADEVAAFQVSSLKQDCNFTKATPLGTVFSVSNFKAQYEEYVAPGASLKRCLTINNLAKDTIWPKYAQIPWSAYTSVDSVVKLGKTTGQLESGGSFTIPVTIDATNQGDGATFLVDIVLQDATGLNAPLILQLTVYVTNQTQRTSNGMDSCPTKLAVAHPPTAKEKRDSRHAWNVAGGAALLGLGVLGLLWAARKGRSDNE